jgi:hypothetical protein
MYYNLLCRFDFLLKKAEKCIRLYRKGCVVFGRNAKMDDFIAVFSTTNSPREFKSSSAEDCKGHDPESAVCTYQPHSEL